MRQLPGHVPSTAQRRYQASCEAAHAPRFLTRHSRRPQPTTTSSRVSISTGTAPACGARERSARAAVPIISAEEGDDDRLLDSLVRRSRLRRRAARLGEERLTRRDAPLAVAAGHPRAERLRDHGRRVPDVPAGRRSRGADRGGAARARRRRHRTAADGRPAGAQRYPECRTPGGVDHGAPGRLP